MENIRKLQLILLSILKEFIKICDENNLRYYAIAGTALGAVRHNGFIPWDDDIDVSMPREDYEKFYKIVSESGSSTYELETVYTHENHDIPAMKFVDKRVVMTLKRKKIVESNCNAYIDIFPLDGLPSGRIARFFTVRRFLINRKLFYVSNFDRTADYSDKTKPIFNRAVMWIIYNLNLQKFFNKRKRALAGDKLLKKHSFSTAKYCSPELWGHYRAKAVFPVEWIGDGALMPFEDIMIMVPVNYEQYLSQLIGNDYMVLPPVEKRLTHSEEIIFPDEGM